MTNKRIEAACKEAFEHLYDDPMANRQLAVEVHNAIANDELVECAMPKLHDVWKDERGKTLVAIPIDQFKELIQIRDEYSNLMELQNRNLHGYSRSELRRRAILEGKEMPTFENEQEEYHAVGGD